MPPHNMLSSDREKAKLLSTAAYDDDAASLHSDDDHDSVAGKTSLEVARHDQELLDSEDERENLLAAGSRKAANEGSSTIRTWERRNLAKERRRRRKDSRRRSEENELMYEMEEGGEPSDSELSNSIGSSQEDLKKLGEVERQRSEKKQGVVRGLALGLIITGLFLVLLYGAYRATLSTRRKAPTGLSSNGTDMFAPTTILISLDGFRADFLNRRLTPTLNTFVEDGVSPRYMLPSFPSVTFPNHYTMATGLYPESHGIVGNTFWDPELKEHFECCDGHTSLNPKWWFGEPLWVTAEKQGLTAAIHMYPGSEAHIGGVEPAYVDKYNGSELLSLKVDRVLGWLDLPGPGKELARENTPRPQMIAMYVPVVDSDGHKYGPNSTEIRKTIKNVDNMLNVLFTGIEQRNLTGIVNIVVVSDHGMATTSADRLIQYEDLVDPDLIEHIDGWPLFGLRPKDPSKLQEIYEQLKAKAEKDPSYEVYLRDVDMPERYHFHKHDRIAPLWIVPQTGWAIVQKHEFDVQAGLRDGLVYHPRGLHGYDFEHPLMRAIFVARGPAFPHQAGSRVDVFQNTNIYNIICDSLGLEPAPNNGTIRLPFKPVGLHSDPDAPVLNTPPDSTSLPDSTSTPIALAPTITGQPTENNSDSFDLLEGDGHLVPLPEDETKDEAETTGPSDDKQDSGNAPTDVEEFWKWFLGKVGQAKDWAKGIFHKDDKGDLVAGDE